MHLHVEVQSGVCVCVCHAGHACRADVTFVMDDLNRDYSYNAFYPVHSTVPEIILVTWMA